MWKGLLPLSRPQQLRPRLRPPLGSLTLIKMIRNTGGFVKAQAQVLQQLSALAWIFHKQEHRTF
jgi:hypothetical protein